jgi:hypothetical protein
MSRWTDEELRELITLWPTHSVSQIAKRLHRQHSEIRSKAKRLRLDGLPPHNPSEHFEHFDVNPPKRRPPQNKVMPTPLRQRRTQLTTKDNGEPWYPGDQRGRN